MTPELEELCNKVIGSLHETLEGVNDWTDILPSHWIHLCNLIVTAVNDRYPNLSPYQLEVIVVAVGIICGLTHARDHGMPDFLTNESAGREKNDS